MSEGEAQQVKANPSSQKTAGSYFTIDESVPIPSERISINPVHNLNLGEGQKLEFFIDPATCQYLKPKSTGLQFNVKISLPAGVQPSRVTLDSEIGANILLKEFRCYNGDRSVLLEEITGLNVLTALKYDYETDQNLRNKRCLVEGCNDYDPSERCTHGGIKGKNLNIKENPYFKGYEESAQTTDFDADTDYLLAKVVLPINSGLWGQERMLLVEAMGGLRLEWILEDNKFCFRKLDNENYFRNLKSNPFFLEKTANSLNNINDTDKFTTFYVSGKNNMRRISNFPFVCGQSIKFVQTGSFQANGLLKIGDPQIAATDSGIIKEIGWEATANGGNGAIAVTLTAENTLAGWGATSDTTIIVDNSIVKEATYKCSYEISDCELLLERLMPPAPLIAEINSNMKQNGKYKYDYPAWTNYKISQGKTDRVANLRLNINNSRCKSLLAIPVDATIRDAKDLLTTSNTYNFNNQPFTNVVTAPVNTWLSNNRSARSRVVGVPNHLTSYQMVYNNVLNPSEAVNVAKTTENYSINQIDLFEREKAISSSGWQCLSLKNYYSNFFVGRSLSAGNGTYDARDKGDFNIQLNYEEATAPEVDMLWHCFVHHIRRLNITGGGVNVEI